MAFFSVFVKYDLKYSTFIGLFWKFFLTGKFLELFCITGEFLSSFFQEFFKKTPIGKAEVFDF